MKQKLGDGPAVTAMKAAQMPPIFSMYLKGDRSEEEGGEITFGGVNDNHLVKDTKLEVSVIGEKHFLIQMDEVTFGETEMCTKEGDVYCKASVDSGCSLIVGPKQLIDDFNRDELRK